jgi:hypothetical protein
MVDKRRLRTFSSVQNLIAAARKTYKFVPSRNLRTPEIKTSNTMLFDSGNSQQIVVELAIMAEYSPPFSTNLGQPFIVWRRVFELKFILWIMMIFHAKRRPSLPK